MIDLSNYSIFEIYLYFFKNANRFNLNLYKGVFYITIHMLYGLLIILTLLVIKNINYLFITYIIVCINIFVIFKLKRCPLAELERYNINFSCIDYIFKYLYIYILNNNSRLICKNTSTSNKNPKRNKKNKQYNYFKHLKDNNIDEITLENLMVCATCIICKIMIIMLYETFILK